MSNSAKESFRLLRLKSYGFIKCKKPINEKTDKGYNYDAISTWLR